MYSTVRPMVSHWSLVNGLPMHARVSVHAVPSERPTLVLLHGFLISSRYMVPTAIRLAPFFRTLAPDLPGFGRSAAPSRVLDVPALADALIRWMDGMGLEQPVLIGNSLGCQIAVDVAVRYPTRVDRMVLCAPTLDPAARTTYQQLWRLLRDVPRERISLIPLHLRDQLAAGPTRAIGTLAHLLNDPVEIKLPYVQASTLVVRGDRDPVVPARWANEMVDRLPQGRLITIPGAPHALNYSTPRRLTRIIATFLGR